MNDGEQVVILVATIFVLSFLFMAVLSRDDSRVERPKSIQTNEYPY